METYMGGCHCKAVRYEARGVDLSKAMVCNCSHCSAKGFYLTFISAGQFTLLSGDENLTDYQFGRKIIHHLFCKTCGVESFARGTDREGNPTVMVNLRTLDGVDIDSLTPHKFNGKDF